MTRGRLKLWAWVFAGATVLTITVALTSNWYWFCVSHFVIGDGAIAWMSERIQYPTFVTPDGEFPFWFDRLTAAVWRYRLADLQWLPRADSSEQAGLIWIGLSLWTAALLCALATVTLWIAAFRASPTTCANCGLRLPVGVYERCPDCGIGIVAMDSAHQMRCHRRTIALALLTVSIGSICAWGVTTRYGIVHLGTEFVIEAVDGVLQFHVERSSHSPHVVMQGFTDTFRNPAPITESIRDALVLPNIRIRHGWILSCVVPLWLPTLLFAISGAMLWRTVRRYGPGRCIKCNYDLRGTVSDRCSECGTPVERTT